MMTLSHFTKLNDIRKNKKALFASLSAVEVEVLDKVAAGGACFGGFKGRVVLDAPGRRETDSKTLDSATAVAMVRAGWLRFVPSPVAKGSGYFWMTTEAERVWREMGRKVS